MMKLVRRDKKQTFIKFRGGQPFLRQLYEEQLRILLLIGVGGYQASGPGEREIPLDAKTGVA
jgi:hypothetical protein